MRDVLVHLLWVLAALLFAGGASFGVAAATWPYPDIARAWLTIFTAAGLGGALVLTVAALLLRAGRAKGDPGR